ncbi:hypothetical protein [Alcaligenes sp. HNGD-HTN06]
MTTLLQCISLALENTQPDETMRSTMSRSPLRQPFEPAPSLR